LTKKKPPSRNLRLFGPTTTSWPSPANERRLTQCWPPWASNTFVRSVFLELVLFQPPHLLAARTRRARASVPAYKASQVTGERAFGLAGLPFSRVQVIAPPSHYGNPAIQWLDAPRLFFQSSLARVSLRTAQLLAPPRRKPAGWRMDFRPLNDHEAAKSLCPSEVKQPRPCGRKRLSRKVGRSIRLSTVL